MGARLYGMAISYPSQGARLMLEHKGIDYDLVEMAPGAQAFRVRLAGFRGGTVPALKLDGRRVLGSRSISRVLDDIQPEPPLFPAEPIQRRAVEEAEEWGESVLQPIPRRLLRWAVRNDHGARVMFARATGVPQPKLAAHCMGPLTALYARREDAGSAERVRADWTALPGHLDHAEQLIADGVIGGPAPNAADFQIATTLRGMLAFDDFEPLVAGRPLEQLARRILPEYPHRIAALRHLVPR